MNTTSLFLLTANLATTMSATLCSSDALPGLMPWPVKVTRQASTFAVNSKTVIVAPKELSNEAELLAQPLRQATSLTIPVELSPAGDPKSGTILLQKSSAADLAADGSYNLKVTPERVTIEAGTPAGVFYGTRTLLQLLPAEAAVGKRPSGSQTVEWVAPCVEIRDQPRFTWRGFMLDEARNFHGMDAVKDYLDEMAAMKMNVFHWHLIDNEGWRLEIQRYPKLTSVGALSPGTSRGGVLPPRDPSTPAGRYYYTKKEAQEIIAYAAQRHIRVVPEVEMPGHCRAALKAYPEWGAAGIMDVSNPVVVKAMQTILDEVMDLFPEVVIHTGGDEVNYKEWETAPSIKAAMKQKGLKSSEPLQKEFTSIMAKYIAAKGRRMMYWADSIKQIPGEKSTIVQVWRGSEKLIPEALSRGYDILNCWNSDTYLDYNYARLPLERTYSFDPMPPSLDAKWHKQILGLGGQAWGEYMPSRQRVEYQVFPRLAALAEVGWTAKNLKNYGSFLKRLQAQKRRWDLAGIQYARNREKPSQELWKEVASRGTKIGNWTPDQLKKGSRYSIPPENDHDWVLTGILKGKGRCLVTFVGTDGRDKLHVRQVQLLENGTPIAADPAGMAGAEYWVGMPVQNAYVFDVAVPEFKADAKYTLRTNYNVLNGTDTKGDIFLLNP